MSRRHISWLLGELPRLVDEGVVSAESADKLRGHYQAALGEPRGWVVNLFAVLGSVLVGGGGILLVAANWDELSRPLRTVVSLTPLVIAISLAAGVLLRDARSAAWREGVGVFWTFAIGTAIAMVGQTYHFPADTDRFLLVWVLLALPIIYLLRSSLVAVLCLGGITWWTAIVVDYELWFWPLLALVAFHLVWLARREAQDRGPWESVMAWAVALAATGGVFLTVVDPSPLDYAVLLALAGLFGALYSGAGSGGSRWRRAFRKAGALGSVVMALVLTGEGLWGRVARLELDDLSPRGVEPWAALAVTALLFVAGAVWFAKSFLDAARAERLVGALFALTAAGYAMSVLTGSSLTAVAVFNLYVFALGLLLTLDGVNAGDRSRANWGLAVLSLLILIRFFDSELTFVLRGLAFIAVGLGFLVFNFYLSRRSRRSA